MNNIKTLSTTDSQTYIKYLCPPPFLLLGKSNAIDNLKGQLAIAVQTRHPIIIYGEPGTEKQSLAKYIHHCQFASSSNNFISVPSNINELDELKHYLYTNLTRIDEGTLFFPEINKLSNNYKYYLSLLFSESAGFQQLLNKNVQIIISSTKPVAESDPFLSSLLRQNRAKQEILVPPLRQQRQDICLYIDFFLDRFGGSNPPQLSEKARETLCNYDWPDNMSQLRSVMMLLATNPSPVIETDALQQLNISDNKSGEADLIDAICNDNLNQYQKCHPALYKSLSYICRHYREEISLSDVANASFISPSHLSFLFRQHLNYSFKCILVQARVRFAKEVITQKPMIKITDICLQSGFGDLSHFEKMFKRYEGCTPRQYRARQRQTYQHSLAG